MPLLWETEQYFAGNGDSELSFTHQKWSRGLPITPDEISVRSVADFADALAVVTVNLPEALRATLDQEIREYYWYAKVPYDGNHAHLVAFDGQKNRYDFEMWTS